YSFVELSELQKNGAHLFHHLLVFENYPIEAHIDSEALRVSFRESILKLNYPLEFIGYNTENSLVLNLRYDETYLTTHAAIRLLSQFQ
ncbi:hypothetical protein, partial [Legionella oakridgensis]|uniref:hypothetical protein n=1 Tax=Legionella oakridgensis TaxID=29423 RepID=UPI00055D0742